MCALYVYAAASIGACIGFAFYSLLASGGPR
jgi:hypothetical protein